jgi:hypothetical protein
MDDINQSIMKLCLSLNSVNPQIVVPSVTNPNEFIISFLKQITKTRLLPKIGMIRPLLILLDTIAE